ncbi:hypothetical protein [Streptomyces sp. NPDC055400]
MTPEKPAVAIHADRSIEDEPVVSAYAGFHPPDPDSAVALRRLRRTIAWIVYRRPGKRIALAVEVTPSVLPGTLTIMMNREEAAAARQRVIDAYAQLPQAVPDVAVEDLRQANQLAWAELDMAGAPLDAPGERIYALGFVGPGPDLKVGLTSSRPGQADRSGRTATARIKSLERIGLAHHTVMVRAWISRPVANARDWEAQSLNVLGALEGATAIGEYFRGVDFDLAMDVIHSVRSDSMTSVRRVHR